MRSFRIVEFYTGENTDSSGRFIEDVWSWDYEALELVHDFIQWLFPLKEPSRFNPEAPVLDDETIQVFVNTSELRVRLLKSLAVMLSFYGLKLEATNPPEIRRSAEFNQRKHIWLLPGNHNYLRITRILTSLTQLGLGQYALALFECLEQIFEENESQIGQTTYSYWKAAALSAGVGANRTR
jgi:hypothetical protein